MLGDRLTNRRQQHKAKLAIFGFLVALHEVDPALDAQIGSLRRAAYGAYQCLDPFNARRRQAEHRNG